MKIILSHFVSEHSKIDEETKKLYWIKQNIYYYNDLSNINLNTDYRFKEIPNKRKQAKFIKLINNKKIVDTICGHKN